MSDLPDWTQRIALTARTMAEGTIYAVEAGNAEEVIAGIPGEVIVIDAATFTPQVIVGGNPGEELREWVLLRISDVPNGFYLGGGALSPENPACYVPIDPGSARAPVGAAVQLLAQSRPGSGRQLIQYVIAWHSEQ